MREKLQSLRKKRHEFTARVGRRGHRKPYRGRKIPVIVLENICIAGEREFIADHLWVDAWSWARGLERGNAIKISARVKWYEKGYFDTEDKEVDYTLEGVKLLANYGVKWRGDLWLNRLEMQHD